MNFENGSISFSVFAKCNSAGLEEVLVADPRSKGPGQSAASTCPNGKISSISSSRTMSHHFIYFYISYYFFLFGMCESRSCIPFCLRCFGLAARASFTMADSLEVSNLTLRLP